MAVTEETADGNAKTDPSFKEPVLSLISVRIPCFANGNANRNSA